MEPRASAPPWIPEDDVVLKNAVEAGASLEALAKGAVQFSRRFTVRELRDRWHSLLYDPDISAKASIRMVEFELPASNLSSKSNTFGNCKESSQVLGKRKIGSIHSLYNAMRKKFRIEALNSSDLSFPPAAHECTNDIDGSSQCVPSDHEPVSGNCVFGDSTDHYGQGETNSGILHHPLPRIKRGFVVANAIHSEQDSLPNEMLKKDRFFQFPADDPPLSLQAPIRNDSRHSFEGLMLEEKHTGGLDSSTAISEGELVYLPDSLLNFENEDELLFIDTGVKHTVNMSPSNNLSSLLLRSPNDDQESEIPTVAEHDASASSMENKFLEIPGGVCPAELDCLDDPSYSSCCNQQQAEVNVPQTLVPKSPPTEICGQVLFCTLNSEDPDIPNNDDIVFPMKVATPFVSSLTKPISKEASNPASTSNNKESGQRQGLVNKNEFSAQPFKASKLVGSNKLSEIGLANQRIISEVKPANIGRAVVSKHADNNHQGPSKSHTAVAALNHTMDEGLEVRKFNYEEHKMAEAVVKEHSLPNGKETFAKMELLEQEGSSLTSDLEEYESDDDVPCFSDIEAMILDMDLGQCYPDCYISEKVLRYRNEDAKRKIMRLEQCAHSSLQRALASRGAFAILYGRHVKYHIKKAEVLLGRATDDADVDIDLGREGQANKISRRQAIIKLERDGSFGLKNIGRSSIFVNGNEVASRKLLRLNSSSLIEIRELNFVFELNHEAVSRYVAGVNKRSEQKNSKFEWSPGGGP